MASSYGSVSTVNISTGVKAKLQKWMGKASTNVRDKRAASYRETSAEMMDYEPQLLENNAMPVPHHSRTRSAPIPMLNGEKIAKKPRKSSVSSPPIDSTKDQGDRENGRIKSYPKNGIPQGLSHSMVLYESSSDPSSSLQKQNIVDCHSKALNVEDQTGSAGVNATLRIRAKSMNSLNAGKKVLSSRAVTKGNRHARVVSKTSGEYSDESASSDNERIASNLVFDSSSNDVQQLSGQIQSRLQKWVERASYLAAMRDRRPSEESASSTDDSLNPPESPNSKSSGSEPKSWNSESPVKKIKELELALKELVENVGVRTGGWPSKQDGTQSPGSRSSGQRSRHNSQRENEELGGNGQLSLLSKIPQDNGESGLRKSRNNSSSSEPDACVNMTDGDSKLMIDNPEESNGLLSENQMEDVDDVIFMKSSCPIRDQNKTDNPHTHNRRSVTLQEVLLCETLIEQFPKQNDGVKKIDETNSKKDCDDTSMKSKVAGEALGATTGNKNRSSKTELTEGQTTNENFKLPENKTRDGAGKKLERPKLRKQVTAPDGNYLKVGTDLSVRESMRQYLNFKDADLSAFAVECVRYANKKKQILRAEDAEKENLGGKTLRSPKKANTNETVQTTEQKPIVVISSQDEDGQTERSKTPPASCGSLLDDETANEPIENERRSRYSFSRTAEEAEWFAKEFIHPTRENRVAEKESLGRSSSNPQGDPVTSQRLYKFPSMPMFYIPKGNVDSENGKEKKSKTLKPSAPLSPQRRSTASFPAALESLNTRSDPFYHGLSDSASTTKQRASSSSCEAVKDENDNEVSKTSARPTLRKRKMSAPSRSGLYPMTSNVRVDIEALI